MRLTPALTALVLAALPSLAARAQGTRSEIPIKEVVLSDGTRRYSVLLTVGSTTIDAGLDSGSTGLRVLPGVLLASDAVTGSRVDTYAFGSGAELKGVIGKGTVSIGDLSAQTGLQLIRTVGCTDRRPNCPASKIALKDYGIQGDGLSGEGFKAIIGVNMGEAEVPSPLKAIGARRWIIELPRPNEGGPGRLILNPTEDEVSGFVRVRVLERFAAQGGGLHDAIMGCLLNEQTKAKACGPTLLDTGAPGIQLSNSDLKEPWRPQTTATLGFFDNREKLAATVHFQTDLRSQASRLSFIEQPAPKITTILSGLMPYFAFSVLYDPDKQELGLQARAPASGGPVGVVEKDTH
jgi:hypothetical protein